MSNTWMRREALEAPLKIEQQLRDNLEFVKDFSSLMRSLDPQQIITMARGSSDHAAQYFNFLAMEKLGLLPTSLSMSALIHYHAPLKASRALAVAISQSGQSPDVVLPLEHFKKHALCALAMVNTTDSPLEKVASHTLRLRAGEEKSVAATKSFLCSLSASAQLMAHWSGDKQMIKALDQLPQTLNRACEQDWSKAIEVLKDKNKLFVCARGHGLSLAFESALKFKETCAIQAEGFSGAEIQHGPQALIKEGYPLLVFALSGPTQKDMIDLSLKMRERGAQVILAAPENIAQRDVTISSQNDSALDVISAAQSFYLMVEELSRVKGLDPDCPHYLAKVTLTK